MAETALTHRRVLNVAVPIVLANVTVPLLGMVDTGVVGQIGEAAPIGAVGIGAIILTALYWVFGFLRMGTAGMAAQARGAGDGAENAALLIRALLIGGAAGAGIIALQVPLFHGAFMISPASAEVEGLAQTYMAIRVWSAPALIAGYGIIGWLVAQERTRAILVIQLVMNGVNILLDVVFVMGLGWGVAGVAWATFLAEWSGLFLGLWYCRGVFAGSDWNRWPLIFDRVRLRYMAVVNTDILIRSVLLQAIFVSFLLWGADFGDATLAANQILLQLLSLTAHAMDGFAFAAEAFVGSAMGARRPGALRRSALLTSFWGLVVCLGLSVVFAVMGPWIIDVMAKNADVRTAAREFLPYMVAAPLLGLASFMLDGIFIGATRTTDMRNMMVISAMAYFAAVIPLMMWLDNHGLWLGLLISFVVRGVTLGWKYPALERAAA